MLKGDLLRRLARSLSVAMLAAALAISAPTEAWAQHEAAGDPKSRATPLALQELTALEHPWAVEVMPSGALLITEKPGRLRIFRNGTLSAPVAGVPRVAFRDQGGLLDVALDPNFARNRLIYLSYSEPAGEQSGGRDVPDTRLGPFQDLSDAEMKGLAIARARLDGARLSGLEVIWRAEKTAGRGHFGGRMAFAPDGALLIASGDRQRFEPAQDRASDLGKVLRIRAADGAALPDNPFAGAAAAEHDVWSYGHRNPLGIAIRPGTSEIWVAEMGPQNGDEINVLRKGANFGWPLVSPGDNYDATALPRPRTQPAFEVARESFPLAISPSSLVFYTGAMFAPWQGDILVGGLSSQGVLRGKPSDDGVHDLELVKLGFRVRDIAQAPDGALLLLRDGPQGGLVRMTPTAP